MAEIKTGIFAKNVQKRLNRAQEKVLQKLGKADETKDEQFEQVVINFKRQESEGSRLQREMKAYMASIKGMQQASINLSQSLHEVYEPDWHGKDDVLTIGKDCDALWEDFHNKLVDSTLLNLDGYLQQFPDLKTRVAKRSRKLIDYDSARHHVETLQASGMKNDRKIMKAEDELKKAQRVFDELNVGLQDELPTLWDCRVDFYISTFKNVTSLEAKFHREISLVCKELYEVMTQLAEQHSDKMFTIQGAPSDSGPLRLARTPSPPEDESPPESPDASSNHMLRPVSPGPPRPKSPAQLKKGPPVPPPPKATPTKEVAEEQIIDLFGGEFLPAPSPSQPNERPGQSLLDLDFDDFQADESVSPIPQASTQPAPPGAEAGFVADWSADFGSASANGDAASTANAPGVPEPPAAGLDGDEGGVQGGAQGWPHTEGMQPAAEATPTTQDSESTAAEEEVSSWESQTHLNLHPSETNVDDEEAGSEWMGQEDRRKSTPGLIFTNEYGEEIEDSTEERGERWSRSQDGSGSEYETAEEGGDVGQGGGWMSADDELSYDDRSTPNASEELGSGAEIEAAYHPQTGEPGSDPFAETEGRGAFDSDPFAETQGRGAFDSDPFAETQGGGAFDSDPFAETQGGGAFDSDPFAETQGGGAFDSDPLAETQGGGAFDSDPFAETQGGGAFDSDPFAETQGGGAFDSDPFAETQGGGALDSDPLAETQGGGAFDSDPFAETQGGGAFDSDPFAETQGGVAFDSDPFAETQGGGAFDSDPFAETQGGDAFDSDPFAETQGGGAFDSDPFAETQGGEKGSGLEVDPSSEEGGVVVTGDGRSGWATDPFANSFPASPSGTGDPVSNTASKQEVNASHGFNSSVTQPKSMCGMASGRNKDGNKPGVHKEPENSDMSEDEDANRRLGKLYQELDTEKAEVAGAFNGFSQDAAAPSFFADFDNMKKENGKSNEASEAPETQVPGPTDISEEQNKPPAPSTGGEVEETPSVPAGEVSLDPSVEKEVEETLLAPAGEVKEPEAPPPDEEKESLKEEDVPAVVGSPDSERTEIGEITPAEETKTSLSEVALPENMPIPSVVIEPASSNEGDDDRDGDIISPTTISDNGMAAESQTIKHMSPSEGVSGLPADFLYKVETMHDFEAANSDELELKRGDIVLVVPTASMEDQDAGWLTGMKESEWLTLGTGAQRGLFPDNFTQRLE